MKQVLAGSAVAVMALGLAPVVSAADVALYGSLRYGVAMEDANDKFVPDAQEDTMWNLGSNRSSRWGVKGSMEAGEGLTAGFKMERAVGGVGGTMGARHHHVYLSGGFGTVTIGQQSSPYYGATTWDSSSSLGGVTDFVFRSSGVSYASSLGGPFDFKVLFGSGKGGAEKAEDGVNHIEASASFSAGPVNMSLGIFNDDDEGGVDGVQRIGGTVGGNVGPINWQVGFDSGEDSKSEVKGGKWMGGKVAAAVEDGLVVHDDDRYGLHLGYAVSEAGNLYTQYSGQNWSDDEDLDADRNSWLIGYKHVLAPGVTVYGEYRNTSVDATSEGVTVVDVSTDTAVVALKVDF